MSTECLGNLLNVQGTFLAIFPLKEKQPSPTGVGTGKMTAIGTICV